MASSLAQMIFDMKLNALHKGGVFNRIKTRIVNTIFNRIKNNNVLIEASVGKLRIKLPITHQLPFLLKGYPYYSTNLARIASQVYLKYNSMTFIDIGANVGDSVALLRTQVDFPILCIEGDEYFFSILEKNTVNSPNVFIVKRYVGEQSKEIKAASVELGGTAHLNEDDTSSNTIYIETLSSILQEHTIFSNSKMLKIDTDGFDNKIIRGSIDFLKLAKPITFFEYDPFFLSEQNDDGISIFDTLFNIGYRNLLVYENNGELLLSADISNVRLIEDINNFYTGRKGSRYCDICAFHEEDNDLFNITRNSEIIFFKNSRK